MTADEERAARYRARAEEVRTIASGVDNKECREKLLLIATDYEGMADSVRAIEASRLQIQKPANSN
jgi:hypothetical protein